MEKLPKHIKNKIDFTDSCWLWTGTLYNGYGNTSYMGKSSLAHRATFSIIKGEISNNLVIDHLCRNRNCVNPEHLEAVTPRENILRGASPSAIYAKRTHCNKGHKFNRTNTLVREDNNSRRCKICHLKYHKLYRESHKKTINEYHRTLKRDRKEYMRRYREKNRQARERVAED